MIVVTKSHTIQLQSHTNQREKLESQESQEESRESHKESRESIKHLQRHINHTVDHAKRSPNIQLGEDIKITHVIMIVRITIQKLKIMETTVIKRFQLSVMIVQRRFTKIQIVQEKLKLSLRMNQVVDHMDVSI